MTIEEYLEKIGITYVGEYKGSEYVINLADSDEYSYLYSKLENAADLELDEENVEVSDSLSKLHYENTQLEVDLVGNFTTDDYKCVVKEKNND